MKRWRLSIGLFLCSCGFAIAQGGDGHDKLAVELSRSKTKKVPDTFSLFSGWLDKGARMGMLVLRCFCGGLCG